MANSLTKMAWKQLTPEEFLHSLSLEQKTLVHIQEKHKKTEVSCKSCLTKMFIKKKNRKK